MNNYKEESSTENKIKNLKKSIRKLKVYKTAFITIGFTGCIFMTYALEHTDNYENNYVLQGLSHTIPIIFLGVFTSLGLLFNQSEKEHTKELENIYINNPELKEYNKPKKLIKK